MAKNIVVFSDGTGQEGGKGNNSNVYKLFNFVEDRTKNQIVFYDPGLGTGFRKLTGNISGAGISRNILESYNFIFNNFEAGDQIFLLGFSRGAATVRSLSSFIHLFGILPKSRRDLVDAAWRIYKIRNSDKRALKAKEFISKNHTMWAHVKFIGVWDTVAALGLPINFLSKAMDKLPFFHHKFHNFDLSKCIENAYQALSIDDERKTFHPLVWNPKIRAHQKLKQVWFAGVHTDVGGGYKEHSLSDIPLVWIMQKAAKHGLLIYAKHHVSITPDANGKMHNSRKGFPKSLFLKKQRTWDEKTHGKPIIHASVLKRKFEMDTKSTPYKPWILDFKFKKENWVKALPKSKTVQPKK